MACLFIYAVRSLGVSPAPKPDCSKWLDSLVAAGKRSLDSRDIPSARRYFTLAYTCGMSKDSMCYFAAEMYLRSFALDTALTFNWALEKGGHFNRALYLEQRSRIFRMIGWKREADSLLTIIRKREQHDVAVTASVSRSILSLNPFTLTPINLTFRPDADIDDIGSEGMRYRWSRYRNSWLKRTSVTFDVATDLPLPTRHSFDEASDTLIRSFGLYAGAGDFPSSPECMFGHSMAVHTDNKIDHFDKFSCSFPIGRNAFLSTRQDIKWTQDQGVDDNKTELSFSQLSFGRKYSFFYALSASYHFSNTDFYQNKSGTSGIYRLIPLGYVDSLNPLDSSEPRLRYFRDRNLTTPFESDFISDYWAGQPGMRLFTLPRHDVNAALKSSFQLKLPLHLNLVVADYIQCIWYPERMTWFSIDDSVRISYFHLYNDYAVVYNAVDGKYYITTQRTQLNFMKGSLVELKKHEKTRIDCYFSLSFILEKRLGDLGKLYFSTTYLKGLSTLSDNDPMVCLNHFWQLQAGWKKDISYTH